MRPQYRLRLAITTYLDGRLIRQRGFACPRPETPNTAVMKMPCEAGSDSLIRAVRRPQRHAASSIKFQHGFEALICMMVAR